MNIRNVMCAALALGLLQACTGQIGLPQTRFWKGWFSEHVRAKQPLEIVDSGLRPERVVSEKQGNRRYAKHRRRSVLPFESA